MTRKDWDEHFDQHVKALRNEHPTWSQYELHAVARQETVRLHGPRPEKGERMTLPKLPKPAVKALKGAATSALTIMAIFGVDVFIQAFDTSEELTAIGVPLWTVPFFLGAVSAARNWLKHKQRRVAIP